MKQFFEMYAESEKLSPLVREIKSKLREITEIAETEDIEE